MTALIVLASINLFFLFVLVIINLVSQKLRKGFIFSFEIHKEDTIKPKTKNDYKIMLKSNRKISKNFFKYILKKIANKIQEDNYSPELKECATDVEEKKDDKQKRNNISDSDQTSQEDDITHDTDRSI